MMRQFFKISILVIISFVAGCVVYEDPYGHHYYHDDGCPSGYYDGGDGWCYLIEYYGYYGYGYGDGCSYGYYDCGAGWCCSYDDQWSYYDYPYYNGYYDPYYDYGYYDYSGCSYGYYGCYDSYCCGYDDDYYYYDYGFVY